MLDEKIKQWHPFIFRYKSFDGKRYEQTFTCPTCGGHNCEKMGDLDRDNFWSGQYRCTDCGETKENGNDINFYSDAFVSRELPPEPKQLSLWNS